MKKLIVTLTAAGLLLSANATQADHDQGFITSCDNYGGTVLRNLYVTSIYSYEDGGIGFDYSQDASIDGNQKSLLMSQHPNAKDYPANDMFNVLQNAYDHELAVDVCLNSSNEFYGVEESEEE